MKKMLHQVLQPHGMFVIIALVFGLVFVRIVPPFWGIDELTHFNRVYQLSTGQLEEHKVDGGYSSKLPANLLALEGYVYLDLTDGKPGPNRGEVDSVAVYNTYTDQHFSKAKQNYFVSGVYSPLAYTGPVIGTTLSRILDFDIGQTILMARLFTLLLYIGIVYIALRILRGTKTVWLVFVVALLPMTLFQASIVNVDSMAISLGLLLFSMVIYFWQRDKKLTRLEFILLLLVATVLSLTKPNYLLLSFAAAFLPARNFGANMALRARTILVAIPLIACGVWEILTRHLSESGLAQELGAAAKHVKPFAQTKFILIHPLQMIYYTAESAYKNDWFSQTFGLLGWNYVLIPTAIIGLLFVTLCMVSLYDKDPKEKHAGMNRLQPKVLLGLGALVSLSILYVFYATYSVVGSHTINGVQGRYFIPALPFIFYGLAKLVPMRVLMTEKTVRVLVPCISIFALIVSAAVYFRVTYG
ncbi:MAG TPA: DUF2142 domain-containing protein [Candidatus Saccharimonadales bacterium]|nr:DUF2142 domain-containing protein [Candidatus Saccharimonadales bacterium]